MLGFAFMFAIAFMLISTPEKTGDIESKAEVLITIRWADEHPDDVDALVEDPQGGLVWWCENSPVISSPQTEQTMPCAMPAML